MNLMQTARALAVSIFCGSMLVFAAGSASADEGYFYGSAGPSTGGPFYLLGGRYFIDVWARMPPNTSDPECIFGGVLERVGSSEGFAIAKGVTLSNDMMPYHYTPTVTLPSGTYRIHIALPSDCNWSAAIVTAGDSHDPPGVSVVNVAVVNGNAFTSTTTLPLGSRAMFSAQYRAPGVDAQSISATIELSSRGKTVASYPAKLGHDANHVDYVYQEIVWGERDARYLGPMKARLVLKAGSTIVSSSRTFTLVR